MTVVEGKCISGRAKRNICDLNPGSADNYIQYIAALESAGQKENAVTALRDFKSKFPNVEGVDEQIARISNAPAAPIEQPVTPDTTTETAN